VSHDVWLSLGSNQGDRLTNLEFGLRQIKQLGLVVENSSIYETEPWGKADQPLFLNLVCRLKCDVSDPLTLLDLLKSIERAAGRTDSDEQWGPRPLDIDILFIGDMVFRSDRLTVPHLLLHQRRFVLMPLSEMKSNLVHPELKLTIEELLKQCRDDHVVTRQTDLCLNL